MASTEPQRILKTAWRRARLWLELLLATRNSERRLRSAVARRVLIVCYGNIYRSPFLAAYLRSRLGTSVAVRSSGFHPKADRPSPEHHLVASERRGVLLHDHRSTVFTGEDADWADIIVVMDRHNWDDAVRRGAAPRKLVWAGSLAGGGPEIADPYAMDESGYEAVLQQLTRAGDTLVAALRQQKS